MIWRNQITYETFQFSQCVRKPNDVHERNQKKEKNKFSFSSDIIDTPTSCRRADRESHRLIFFMLGKQTLSKS